jgi:hypothetical protein
MKIICCFVFLAVATVAPQSAPAPNPWFREKYQSLTNELYYDYMLHRAEWGDNDVDMCPDIHKPATIYAITGQYMNEIKRTCNAIYVEKYAHTTTNATATATAPTHEQLLENIDRMITDFFEYSGVCACYAFEIGMIVMSVILASCSTLFMIMLVFCQY